MLKTGPWKLSDIDSVDKNGLKVFSCFSCGGGSTMGYKLAGYEVLGCCEIDPKMLAIYKKNHNPRFPFLAPIQEFNKRDNYPDELYSLDILDGSPPCSSFSMAGSREKAWGKNKKFREGQANQVLDDLFFEFISLADKLKPKVVVAENVKGLIAGNARGYVKQIFRQFSEAGYETQLFLLNAASMGVPQARERTFFIARRKDLDLPKLHLVFSEQPVPVKKALEGCSAEGKLLSDKVTRWWKETKYGGLFSVCGASTGKMNRKLNPGLPSWTQTATPNIYDWRIPRLINKEESIRIQSFPDDFNFLNEKANYVCGMSVPPYMMQRVAYQICRQFNL
jgi:DNA (cytosine-5)-methyltransferase 1